MMSRRPRHRVLSPVYRLGILTVLALGSNATASRDDDETLTLAPEAIESIRGTYDAADEEEKERIKAFYADMGVDLDAVFAAEAGESAAAPKPPTETLLKSVQKLDFARTPQTVLAARGRLGLGPRPLPAEDAPVAETAKWLHQHVLAGEWPSFVDFMTGHAGDDAEGIYAHVLQSTNQGDPALLPEEVLAMADAAPDVLSDWQLDVLSQLLKTASSKSSTGPMLRMIEEGTRMFGPADDESKARTAKLLAKAGLMIESYAYLPSLEQARSDGSAETLLAHARYYQQLAKEDRQQGDAHNRKAWELYCEATLLEDAEFDLRREGLDGGISLLPEIPPAVGTDWLRRVFADEAIGPASLEVIALKATSISDAKMDVHQRAQSILTMKEAVDTLLEDDDRDVRLLRVPLRMLTTGLVTEAEATIKQNSGKRGVARETEMLLRALPDERWLAAIEPSLAARAYKALIGIALVADEPDLALDLMTDAVDRLPAQSEDFADQFLVLWERRLNPPPDPRRPQYIFYGGYTPRQSAPLTRGRQRRNLDRLARLLETLDAIGVDARRLEGVVPAFRACHAKSEVFERGRIERILGPIEQLEPNVAYSLAENMRRGLSGDWRSKRAHQEEGMRRTKAEIDNLVERGYDLAIELVDAAGAQEPESWRYAMTKAALAYDRLEFTREEDADFATFNEYRKQAFKAFADAAGEYGKALEDGRERAESNVYVVWFNAALGSSELDHLSRDDMLVEGSDRDDQIDLIRQSMLALPEDAARMHIGSFARALIASLNRLEPELKPRVVRHAVRVVGDHPAGAPLRRMNELYEDLVRDEVHLRLTIDGEPRVGTKTFGVLLTMRYTNAVERETGGFAQYLQNNVWIFRGNRSVWVNYRDRLQESIETALNQHLDVEAIGFFESMNPARPIKESGESGWLEKPVAYLVLKVTDPSVDILPSLQMDLSFNDSSGPVTLPVISNTPSLDAIVDPTGRPLRDLEVTQTVDVRSAFDGDEDHRITLEIQARGRGIVPTLEELLDGYDAPIKGYAIADDGIEERPINAVMEDQLPEYSWRLTKDQIDKHSYAEPDEDGMYRLTTERSWVITYERTGGSVGSSFELATLKNDLDGTLTSKQYADMDIIPVASSTVSLNAPLFTLGRLILVVVLAGLAGIIGFLIITSRRHAGDAFDDGEVQLPDRVTPLRAVTMLRRLEPQLSPQETEQLEADIKAIEDHYFGLAASNGHDPDVKDVVRRWLRAAQRKRRPTSDAPTN